MGALPKQFSKCWRCPFSRAQSVRNFSSPLRNLRSVQAASVAKIHAGETLAGLSFSDVLPTGLMDPNNDHDDPWFLIGLVSFGTRVCGRGKPGIYTRVESYVPWILKNIY